MTEQKRYIKLTRKNKSLLRFKVKETPERYNSPQGEVDIFIDAGSGICFEKTCLQTKAGRKFYESPVNKISWHGFYSRVDGEVRLPVINFKQNRRKIATERHKGAICQKDIFMFPICSVYVPKNIDVSGLTPLQKDKTLVKLQLRDDSDVRADFFVLPKNVSAQEFFSDFSISLFFFVADITVFNKALRGAFYPLPISSAQDVEFRSVRIQEWDALIRFVYSPSTREPDLCGSYSILFHDPNDALEMLINRRFGYKGRDNRLEVQPFRGRYLNEKDRFSDEHNSSASTVKKGKQSTD